MTSESRPIISVIIPVYNAGKFLRRCIDSILSQSVGNIEIVAVNDASADDSLEILQSYAEADSRVVVIDKKQNEGSYMARDTGFKAARGDYFFFSDADDFLPENALELLLDKARATGADIVAGDFILIRDDGKKLPMSRHDRLTDKADDYIHAILTGMGNALWGSIFKRRLFEEIEFPEIHGQCFSDDRLVLTRILFEADPKIATVDAPTYYYFVNSVSMTRSTHSDERLRALLDGLFKSYYYLKGVTDRFDRDNDYFMAKNLSFYIERGYNADIIEHFNDDAERLLEFHTMRRLFGLRYAVHSMLCRKSTVYQRITDMARHILWRIKGKE